MRKAVAALLFLISGAAGFAQQKTDKAEVTEGPEVQSRKSYLSDVVGNDADGYYIIRFVKRKQMLEHVNKNLVTDRSVEIPDRYAYKELKRYYSGVTMVGDEMYMLSTVTDKTANTFTLFAQAIDKKQLVPSTELKMVYTYTYTPAKGVMFGGRSRSADYELGFTPSYALSDDKSHILFYRNAAASGASKKERMHLYSFDSKLNELWDNEIELPYDADLFSFDGLTVDNEGNAFITGIEYQERAEARMSRRGGLPSYKYHLLSYKEKGKKMRDYTVELNNNFITDVRTGIAPNGDLVAVGFYSEKGSFSVKGAFYMTIDGETRQVKKQKTTAFETEFITQYMSDREKRKTEKREAKGKSVELYEFDLRNLILQNDGGATIIAEQYYMYTTTTTTRGANGTTTTTTTYHYIYNDIIALSFNSDGSLGWKTKVPKRQHSINDGGALSSYAYAAVGNKLYLIFNDNPKNLYLKDGEQPFQSGGAVSLVTINAINGEATRELLFTVQRGDINLRPKMCLQTGDREMLIYGTRRKTYQFGKVVFDK
jgi:hypothetical protein